ncbi:MAG: sulfatase, partial [Haloarculaceae archaeon]
EFCIYDPLVNVPLLVKHPDLPAGRRDDQVELLDCYHTVLDHVGAEGQGEPLDPDRSLLSDTYREFEGSEYAYVEYHRPVVELKQLENKAAAAGIELDERSRFYSRMRAARRVDGKYIRNERIPDEAYRLDDDPGETEPVGTDDGVVADVEAALAAFEADVGGEWDEVGDDDVLSDMSDDARSRLKDLGYID